MASNEEEIPEALQSRLQHIAPIFEQFFGTNIRMGGGTLLSARWRHRISTDIDLFVPPADFHHCLALEDRLKGFEDALLALPGIGANRTGCTLNGIYSELYGTEITLIPHDIPILAESGTGRFVPGTKIETESTAAILYKRIAHRMIEHGRLEIRDLFDVDTAFTKDVNSIMLVLSLIPPKDLEALELLLSGAAQDAPTPKPLLGVRRAPSFKGLCERVSRRTQELREERER